MSYAFFVVVVVALFAFRSLARPQYLWIHVNKMCAGERPPRIEPASVSTHVFKPRLLVVLITSSGKPESF